MKIIFITRENSEMPAVRVRCYGFAKKLESLGVETEVFSFAEHLGAKSGREERFMDSREKVSYNLKAFQYLIRQKKSIIWLQRFNYHSFAPFVLSFLNDNKLIFDLDDWEARENIVYYFGKWPSSKAEIAMRIIAKSSKLCIGASKFLCNFLSPYNRNVIYIPTGVDIEKFKPDQVRGNNRPIVLSWLGTMHRPDNVENVRFILECFRELYSCLDDIRLEIVGDGIYQPQVYNLVRGFNIPQVTLKPWIHPSNVPAYIQTIDIGVMPLIQKTKFNLAKSPTRIFEYMAMEKPVICSNFGETSYIIKDGKNGFLASTQSEFVAKLKDLIKEKKLRSEVGKEARNTILENYSLNILTNRLFAALRKL